MRWLFAFGIYSFLVVVLGYGLPVKMTLSGLSSKDEQYIYVSTHESILRLIGKAESLNVFCKGQPDLCVRPVDYSHLKANIPVFMEACHVGKNKPTCDDIRMQINYNSRDLITIGLLK